MEEILKSKILDDLYAIRGEELERKYIKKYGKPKEMKKAEEQVEKLMKILETKIKDKEDLRKIVEQFNYTELATMGEYCFWFEKFYKLGFADGISLKKEIKEERDVDNDKNESIIYQNINEISDYIEMQKYHNLKENANYMKITKEIAKIKNKFPKVRDFFENEEIAEFTSEEIKAILDITGLQADRAMYEADEMFKIGLREGKAL